MSATNTAITGKMVTVLQDGKIRTSQYGCNLEVRLRENNTNSVKITTGDFSWPRFQLCTAEDLEELANELIRIARVLHANGES